MTELDKILKQIEAARLASEKRTVNLNALAEADPLHKITDNTITKSHSLTRAYYRFGIVEKRCMEALISKLNPLRSDNKHQEVELSALEYAATYGVSEKHAYRDIGTAIDALMHRVIRVDRTHGKAGKIELTVMLKAEYKDDEGCISCAFNPFITPHLIGLREKFSSYPLSKAVDFSSSYTWRFYEILSSWVDKRKTGGRFMGWIDRQGVDELREMLGVTESYNWGMFQKKVLDVIEAELKEKGNIFVNFERKKTGRKITHLNIKFAESDQQQLPLEGGAGS